MLEQLLEYVSEILRTESVQELIKIVQVDPPVIKGTVSILIHIIAIYKKRKHVQIFCMIKCTEDFEVTLHTHLEHPFIIARIKFYLRKLIPITLAVSRRVSTCHLVSRN